MSSREPDPSAFEPGEILSESIRRRQGQMVLYALECALAAFVRDSVDGRGASVAKSLSAVSTRLATPVDIGQAIGATYLDELVAMAREASKGTSSAGAADRLRGLLDILDVYTIRNACAHPNNPFPPHYWYCLKTIATDKAIDLLKLTGTQEALGSALRGEIRPPPDEWLASILWTLPSNLPAVFEHEATGLIGRKTERDEILRRLRNPRLNLVAVVAPGGVGKTALLLDALREVSATPADSQWVDEIVWITAKTHELTPAGQRRLQPDVSIANVKSAIALALSEDVDDFSVVSKSHESRKILLALDNLETILRDDGSELFAELHQGLPPCWRVVVTSRVPIDGATSLALRELRPEGAVQLANAYLRWKGVSSRPDLDGLVRACNFNPLAIRLALDGFAAGGDLGDVLTQTKKNLIQFSYQTIVDRIEPFGRRILECLFACEQAPTRSDLVQLLGASVDEVAEGLGLLLRTSLVSRVPGDGVEQYELGSGIRDLMLDVPLDNEFRSRVTERKREQTTRAFELDRAQAARNLSPLHLYFVPPTYTPATRDLASRVVRALRSKSAERSELGRLRDELTRRIDTESNALLFRMLGVLLLRLNDRVMALSALRSAAFGADYDPAAALKLAEELGLDQDFDESVELSRKLIEDGWGDTDRWGTMAGMVWGTHWKHRIWRGEETVVAQETENWVSKGELALTAALCHAQARRRAVEYSHDSDEVVTALRACMLTIESLFERFGISGPLAHESSKLIHQLAYVARDDEVIVNVEAQRIFGDFVARRVADTVVAHRTLSTNIGEVLAWLADLRHWLGEPAYRQVRQRISGGTSTYTAPDDGRMLVSIYHRKQLKGRPGLYSSVFARSDDGTEYFIGRRMFGGTDEQWASLRVNDVLVIEPDNPSPGRPAVPVLSALLADAVD